MACGVALRRDSAVDAQWRSFVDALELLPGYVPSSNDRNLGVPS
jgi:hypothetical protein